MKKKIFAFFAFVCVGFSSLYADWDVYGVITARDDVQRTITLDSSSGAPMVVKVLPNTEVEKENCLLWVFDTWGDWSDLTPGTFVKAELVGNFHPNATANIPVVKEITIECGRKTY